MRAKIQQWIYRIQGSYWFVPGLMAIAAIVLSQFTVQLDRKVGTDWMTDSWWASLNQPAGARALLATVAGSMITVTGVTFSLTILAVSYATSHFGPRLLDNFMRDRGNQFTLGTFVATFLYCLLVLRTVRSGNEGSSIGFETEVFVPHVSVLIAILLTLASVGVLIYFIHHIPESIHISNVLNHISEQLSEKVNDLYPERVGEPAEGVRHAALAGMVRHPVRSKYSGYLQGVDDTSLLSFTIDKNAVVELLVRPGQYLLAGQEIAAVNVQEQADDEQESEMYAQSILGSLAIGVARAPTQDIHFLINQFVEIAARALSPGVNDPLTAIQCIDGLSKALVEVSHRSLPTQYREDSKGTLRVITIQPTWEDLVNGALRQLLPYVKPDPNVRAYMRSAIQRVREISTNEELNSLLMQVIGELDSTE